MKALTILIVLIIAGLGEFIGYRYLIVEREQFTLSRDTLSQYLNTNQDFENNLKHFFYKYNLFNTYNAEDAQGYDHYIQLTDLLTETAAGSVLNSFTYKNNGETTFTITFQNYEEAAGFISTLETPVYLDTFEFVQLQGFDAVERESTTGFAVTIFAQFLPENETKL